VFFATCLPVQRRALIIPSILRTPVISWALCPLFWLHSFSRPAVFPGRHPPLRLPSVSLQRCLLLIGARSPRLSISAAAVTSGAEHCCCEEPLFSYFSFIMCSQLLALCSRNQAITCLHIPVMPIEFPGPHKEIDHSLPSLAALGRMRASHRTHVAIFRISTCPQIEDDEVRSLGSDSVQGIHVLGYTGFICSLKRLEQNSDVIQFSVARNGKGILSLLLLDIHTTLFVRTRTHTSRPEGARTIHGTDTRVRSNISSLCNFWFEILAQSAVCAFHWPDCSVGRVTGQTTGVWFPAKERDISLSHRVQIGYGARPATRGGGGWFLGHKVASAWI
jgi:hypothetical protein